MPSTFRRLCLMSLLLAATAAAHALPRGVTGNYYNPAQSGHGVNVEVLDANRAIVYWNVYDDAGKPMPLYMEGRIDGNRIRGAAYAPRGMRFGSFNRADLQAPYWGELDLVFASCANATLHWTSASGFGSGSTPLRRLAYTAACPGDVLLPIGRIAGRVDYAPWGRGDLIGAVLADGSLWATIGSHANFGPDTRVIAAAPASGTASRIDVPANVFPNGFLCRLADPACAPGAAEPMLLPFEPAGELRQARIPSDGSLLAMSLFPGPLGGIETVAGVFRFDVDARFPGRWQLVLGDDGTMCVRDDGAADCLYSGRMTQTDYGLHTFVLQRAGGSEAPFRGYLYVDFSEVFIGAYDLHLVGDNGETGLAFHARYDYRR